MKLDDSLRERVAHELKMAGYAEMAMQRRREQIETLRREIQHSEAEIERHETAAASMLKMFNEEAVFKFGDSLYSLRNGRLNRFEETEVVE